MRRMTATEAAGLVKEGDGVYLSGGCAEPSAILDAVTAEPGLWRGVTLTGAFLPGVNDRDFAALGEGTSVVTIFALPGDIGHGSANRVRLLPIPYTELWHRLAQPGTIDIAFVQVPPPRADGTVGFGISVDFAPALAPTAARFVGLVNPAMPDPDGGPRQAVDRFEAFVDVDAPLREYDAGSLDPATAEIGRRVAELIVEGDRIQLGLGKVQAAVLKALQGRGPLGFHGGMISSPMEPLLAGGTFSLGVTTGVALGSRAFYERLRSRTDIAYRPVCDTHALEALAAVDNFVSVNSVLEVDLFGQANAEMLGARQISGQGGLVDFVRGALRSRGGRSVLALPSTAARGKVSRIVPALGPGVPVTVARADADIVVTEHGVAHLRDADVEERVRRLVAIAHPDFRETLARAWSARDFGLRTEAGFP